MKTFLIALFALSSIAAQAAERKLTCTFSLPQNQNLVFTQELNEGEAEIEHHFTIDALQKSFQITASVWGFMPGHAGRVAGFVSIKQMREDPSIPMNYAINHCELKNYKQECNLEITAVLNGVGARAVCEVPAI